MNDNALVAVRIVSGCVLVLGAFLGLTFMILFHSPLTDAIRGDCGRLEEVTPGGAR